MALKRARCEDTYEDPFCDSLADDVDCNIHPNDASDGDESAALRKMITALWCNGLLNAALITELCYHITESKGRGVSDFALHPSSCTKHGSDHLKLILGKTYKRPEQYPVETPIYDKIACARSMYSMPMRLPTQCILEECKDLLDSPQPDGEDICVHTDIVKYKSHPTVQRAQDDNIHWSRTIPVAIYFDGVQYSKRDSFFVLQLRNLRTDVCHVVSVIRT